MMNYTVCDKCGNKVTLDSPFCSKCGEKINHRRTLQANQSEKDALVEKVNDSEAIFNELQRLLEESEKYKKRKIFYFKKFHRDDTMLGWLITFFIDYILLAIVYIALPLLLMREVIPNEEVVVVIWASIIIALIALTISFRIKSRNYMKEYEELAKNPKIAWLPINYRNPYSYFIIKEGIEEGKIDNMKEALNAVDRERLLDAM